MLVLTRKLGERIFLSGGIEIQLVDMRNDRARIGIKAPRHVGIAREELGPPDQMAKVAAVAAAKEAEPS
jgi:carbon storage regulator CsrA